MKHCLSIRFLKVLGTHVIEKLAELCDLVFGFVDQRLTYSLNDLIRDENVELRTNGKGHRVAGSRVDSSTVIKNEGRLVDVVPQRSDLHVVQCPTRSADDIEQKVMGQRPAVLLALCEQRNRGGLGRPDPDGNVDVLTVNLQQQNRVRRGSVDADPNNFYSLHPTHAISAGASPP